MKEHCAIDCPVEPTDLADEVKMEQKHDACVMRTPDREEVLIDKKIARLLWIIWNRFELHTNNSCEDNFGSVWIEFYRPGGLEIFLTEIAQSRDKFPDLYKEMMDEWKYSIFQYDFAEKFDDENEECYLEGDSEIIFSASLRFPKEDLDRVLECLTLT